MNANVIPSISVWSSCVIVLLLPTLARGQSPPAPQITQLKPATPQQLLESLPAQPTGWLVTRSEGANFFTDHLKSRAIREFTEFLSPEQLQRGITPELVTMEIRDTAGDDRALQTLRHRSSGRRRGDLVDPGMEKPEAIHVERLGERVRMSLILKERFLVQLDLDARNSKSATRWLKAIQSESLLQVGTQQMARNSPYYVIHRVDELNPDLNRSYRVTVNRRDDVERIRRETEAGYRALGLEPAKESETPPKNP